MKKELKELLNLRRHLVGALNVINRMYFKEEVKMTKRVEILKGLVFGDNTVIISKNDAKAIMQQGTLIANIYGITAPEGVNYKIYRVDGVTYIVDMENYAE